MEGAGWTNLIEGGTLDAWRGYQMEEVPASWEVKEGSIFCNGKDGKHLITKKQYENFELMCEWRISKGGNSGVLLRVVEETAYPANSGIEIQVIDHTDGWKDVHGHDLGLGQAAGALYGLYPSKEKAIKKAGEWNTLRIVVHGAEISIWQNDQVIVGAHLDGDDWKTRLAASKFAESKLFNSVTKGHIALQNYRGAGVWYRKMRIRELP